MLHRHANCVQEDKRNDTPVEKLTLHHAPDGEPVKSIDQLKSRNAIQETKIRETLSISLFIFLSISLNARSPVTCFNNRFVRTTQINNNLSSLCSWYIWPSNFLRCVNSYPSSKSFLISYFNECSQFLFPSFFFINNMHIPVCSTRTSSCASHWLVRLNLGFTFGFTFLSSLWLRHR